MPMKAGMVHTVSGLVPLFNELAFEIMPDVELLHLVDEAILKDILATGEYGPSMGRRVGLLASFAEESGARAVMLTCSTLGPLVDEAKGMIRVPFVKVDEAMADEAVRLGTRVGIIATAYTTLEPTSGLVQERAVIANKAVEIETLLCEGALAARTGGDIAAHDSIVVDNLKSLMHRSDVVVLAQASMAQAAEQLPEGERGVPVLSSPRMGVQRFKDVLDALA